MPDLGKYFTGSLWDLTISTGLCFDSTWAGQNLYTSNTWMEHKLQGIGTTWTARLTTQSHTKGEPLYRREEKMVMVQEDQAREPWSLYIGLYTVVKGFKAPP